MIPVGEDGQVYLRDLLLVAKLHCKRAVMFVQEMSDMYTHLLRNRIIFVGQRINDEAGFKLVFWL